MKIKSILKGIQISAELLEQAIVDSIKEQGGYLYINNNNYDGAYVLKVNMDDSISEETIIAIRVESTDKIEVVCTTQPYLFKQDLKESDFDETDWIYVGKNSAEVLSLPTLISIAESIK